MGCQILRPPPRRGFRRRCKHKIHADRKAAIVFIVVLQHGVIDAGGKQHQQTRPGRHIKPGGIPLLGAGMVSSGMVSTSKVGADRPAVAHRQARHQLVVLALGPEAQAPAAAAAVSIEVIDSAQVGIGMVVPSHHLARLTHHRPAALQMQRQRRWIKSQLLQVGPDMALQPADQGREGGVALQLIDTVEVACPGAERIGVGLRLPPQGQNCPHHQGGFDRIGWQGHLAEGQGKQRLESHSRGCHGHRSSAMRPRSCLGPPPPSHRPNLSPMAPSSSTSSSTSPIIRADGLSKTYRVATKDPGLAGTLRHFLQRRYKDVAAVRDVSFQIQPGEMVGFLGPNGAGKTTTLKMLTGLIHPSAGKALVAGYTPHRRQANFLRRITLVMGQKQQLLWDLPALDSLRVNAAVYGIDEAESRQRIHDLAEMLDLGAELKRPLRKLSLGQRMKTELLAALLHRPEVLFLDEPTLGLDVNAQARVRSFLADYNQRFGATVLLTSHYMADITALCPRVLLIHEGRLFHDGSLDALTQRLAPCREVRLELAEPWPLESLRTYGEVESCEGMVVSLLIRRDALTTAVSRLLAELPVRDLEVRDPPIEELIGSLFVQGTLS